MTRAGVQEDGQTHWPGDYFYGLGLGSQMVSLKFNLHIAGVPMNSQNNANTSPLGFEAESSSTNKRKWDDHCTSVYRLD